jgi:hypothetical protein
VSLTAAAFCCACFAPRIRLALQLAPREKVGEKVDRLRILLHKE